MPLARIVLNALFLDPAASGGPETYLRGLAPALAHGVPVAASDLAVLREVGDSWPTHFDPGDPADAARAILAALSDPPDPAIGRSLAARFTWTAAAEGTWGVYDLAVEHRARAGLLVASAGESLG